MKRFFKALLFLVVLVVLAGGSAGLYYFHYDVKPEIIRGFIAKAAPPPTSVAVAKAEKVEWVPGLVAIGSARAFQGIDVASQLAGVVTAIHIGSGQDVEKGAPLYELDTTVERADLKSSMATLNNAEIAFHRQEMLMTGGNTAKANLDSAQAARDQAAAAVERVKALITQKTLVAPFTGRLGIRKLDVGQFAAAGTSLITLQQLDPIFVDFPMPEQSLGALKQGETVDAKVDAYPGAIFHGKIDLIDARIAAESRSVMVRALFHNADRRLLPGMFTNVEVLAGAPREVTVVPRTAVSFSLYGDSVFLVKPKPHEVAGTAGSAQAATAAPPADARALFVVEKRFVRTGEIKGEQIAIKDGVAPGEIVVSQGQIKLMNGATVVIDPNAKLVPPAVRPKE